MIKLRTLNLEKFDITNIDHYTLAKRLHTDLNVTSYISANFLDFVEKIEVNGGEDDYQLLTPYVVRNEKNVPVGMLGSLSENKNKEVDLWYAINPNYRGYGYGRKILSQITQYLIEEKYDDIILEIDSKNVESNGLAISQGYNKVTESYNGRNKINVYQYFKE